MYSHSSTIESSLLMWALSALIVCMAAHVMLGWMRQAQEEWEWDFARVRQVLVGSTTFATALSVSIPLGLAGEAVSFPIGYSRLAALALWLGAIFGMTLLALIPVWREEGASAAVAGVLVGASMTGLQWAWMMAVGFRPGVRWDPVFIAIAAAVSAAGVGTAMAIAFPYGDRARRYTYSWRIAAAGLVGLSFLAGYALLLYSADLQTQIGSVYRHELPGTMISLIGGGLVPMALALLIMDLENRRRQRRRLWRARRRGELGPGYGDDSMMPGTESQPPRYQPDSRGHTADAAVVPAHAQAPAPAPAPAQSPPTTPPVQATQSVPSTPPKPSTSPMPPVPPPPASAPEVPPSSAGNTSP